MRTEKKPSWCPTPLESSEQAFEQCVIVLLEIVGVVAHSRNATQRKLVCTVQVESFEDIAYGAYGRKGLLAANTVMIVAQVGFCVAYVSFITNNMNDVLPTYVYTLPAFTFALSDLMFTSHHHHHQQPL
jgi:amino acid permease